MTEADIVKSLRAQGAHDGRSAGVRIDRVEARVKRQDALLVKAFGADELRQRLGAELALELLESAGQDTAGIRARLSAEQQRQESASRQVTTKYNDLANDPRHDPRVTAAIMAGRSNDELRQIIGQVSAEYAARLKRETAASPVARNFMWTDQHGRPVYGDQVPVPLGAPVDRHTGAPAQKTLAVNRSVPELGSEEVPPVSMRDIAAMEAMGQTCSEHEPRPGQKFCPECGRRREATP